MKRVHVVDGRVDEEVVPLLPGSSQKTRSNQALWLWLRIAIVVIGSALASSILQAFPTLEPIILDRRPGHGAGLFQTLCPQCEFSPEEDGSSSHVLGECATLSQINGSGSVDQCQSYPTLAYAKAACSLDTSCSGIMGQITSNITKIFTCHTGYLTNATEDWEVWVVSNAADCGHANANASAPAVSIDACSEQVALASTLYSVSLGLSVSLSLVMGYLFDLLGPRRAALIGAGTVSVAMVILTIALCFPSVGWLVWIAAPLADTAGMLTSYTIYGFTWHAPHHEALVAACFSMSIGLSSALASVAVWLVQECGVPPEYVWLIFAVLAVLSAVICYFTAVTQREFHEKAEEITGEVSIPTHVSIARQIKEVLRWWRSTSVPMTAFFVSFAVLSYCAMGVWSALYVPLAQAILPADQSTEIVALFALISGLVGAIMQPIWGGAMFDLMGFRLYLSFTVAVLSGFWILLAIQTYEMQIVALVVGSLCFYSWAVLVLRWSALVVAPQLIGTSSGLVFALSGIFQIVAEASSNSLSELLGSRDEAASYLNPILLYGWTGVGLGVITVIFLFILPPAAYISRGYRRRASIILPNGVQRNSFDYGTEKQGTEAVN